MSICQNIYIHITDKKKEDMKKCHVLLSFYNLERLLIIYKTCEVYNKYPSNKKKLIE